MVGGAEAFEVCCFDQQNARGMERGGGGMGLQEERDLGTKLLDVHLYEQWNLLRLL